MKKLLLAITVLLGVYWFRAEPQNDSQLVFDRIWISHLPQDERDKMSLSAFLSEDNIGVFQETSAFQGSYDLFGYAGGEGTLTVHMLQDNKKVKVTYKASKCDVKNFDFCLELKGAPRGPVRYYSRKGWEVESTTEAQTKAQQIAAQQD